MCLFEYDQEKHIQQEREESREEGRRQGREEGRKEVYQELVQVMLASGKTPKEISSFCNIPLEVVESCRR